MHTLQLALSANHGGSFLNLARLNDLITGGFAPLLCSTTRSTASSHILRWPRVVVIHKNHIVVACYIQNGLWVNVIAYDDRNALINCWIKCLAICLPTISPITGTILTKTGLSRFLTAIFF